MSTSARPRAGSLSPTYGVGVQDRVNALLQLQKAAQKITSILDLDTLLDHIVDEMSHSFGCVESAIVLRDPERDELVMAAVRGCSVHLKGSRFSMSRGLIGYTASTGKTCYVPDVRQNARYIACEASTLSELDIPLKVDGRVIGVFNAAHPELDAFSPERLQLLQALAGHIAIAVKNAQVFRRERIANERMRYEQDEARRIQQALLPKTSPLIEGFTVDGYCQPAGAVSGDWFDYVPMPNGRWGLVIADVVGKGMPAALVMSATRAIVRGLAETVAGPGEVLSSLNRVLLKDYGAGTFVTMVFAVLHPESRQLTLANAGHPWPILSDGKEARFLQTDSGIPLGVQEGAYAETTVTLPPGSRLLLFTDGITEATNDAGEEFGSGERLQQLLLRPAICAPCILREVHSFTSGRPATDDATLILLNSR
jgi:phosphoserine phosphatase RsbU/P